jgi:hypothetical protein
VHKWDTFHSVIPEYLYNRTRYLLYSAATGHGLNWLHVETLVIALIQLLEDEAFPFVVHVTVKGYQMLTDEYKCLNVTTY